MTATDSFVTTTLANTTRDRRGVAANVGRMVLVLNSPVMAEAPMTPTSITMMMLVAVSNLKTSSAVGGRRSTAAPDDVVLKSSVLASAA